MQPLALTASMLQDAFRGTVAPVPLQTAYRLGLLLVACATVLLPVLYTGLTVLVACGVYYYALHGAAIVEGSGPALVQVMAYVGPLVAGTILVLFMVKPICARPARRLEPIALRQADAPLLFAFVEQVRRAVRAPAPRAIVVDCNVNASASFRRGFASFFARDLTLTIGMPLLAGLSMRQLAGVLAHEFGHFSQGSAMRLTYLIRSVNSWFARVVYERDTWDVGIQLVSKKSDFRIGIIFYMARFMVWATRKILRLLMLLGHAIGAFMLRQMEFDADRYEVRVAGSDTYESTVMRLRLLSVAAQEAEAQLADSWCEKRLCDDHAGLVVALAETMSDNVRKAVESAEQRTTLFDTHPPDAVRIARARQENGAPIFHLDGPSAALLGDWPGLSRRVTTAFYRDFHGIGVQPANLLTLSEFLQGRQRLDADQRSAARYFHGVFGLFHPLALPERVRPTLWSEGEARHVLQRTQDLTPTQLSALDEARQAAKDAEAKPPAEVAALAALRDTLQERFLAALALLAESASRQTIADAETLSREVERYYPALEALAAMRGMFQKALTTHNDAIWAMRHFVPGSRNEQSARKEMAEIFERVGTMTTIILDRLDEIPYPFEHAQGQISVADFARANLPPADGLEWTVVPQSASLLNLLAVLYERLLGRLAAVADGVESAPA